jgi:superfamily I DNA/RNA helicase
MLTKEQELIIDNVLSKDSRTIAINAVAGSGKTTSCHEIIKAYKPKSGFYSAFNKAIVKDSNKRFGDLLSCKTFHALAYQYIKPNKPIEEFNYLSIKENISYDDKGLVINLLDSFYRSDSTNIYDYVEARTDKTEVQELVVKYANKMLANEIPITFNFMLKCLHLMLENKEIQIDLDLVAFDEVQDCVPVTLEIFKLLNANRKIILGDRYQNIYSFMGTINAFECLDNLNSLNLTQSFRCNKEIAKQVEDFGIKYLDKSFKFKGNPNVISSSPPSIVYLSRSNASLIEKMFDLTHSGITFNIPRNLNEIFALPLALLNANKGRPVYDKRYKYLEKEYKNFIKESRRYDNSYFKYLNETIPDPNLKALINTLVIMSQKNINLYSLKDRVSKIKPNKNITLTTVHAYKGLESDIVYIEKDLNNSVNASIRRLNEYSNLPNPKSLLTIEEKENLNTYYVALSRAKTTLMNVDYEGM